MSESIFEVINSIFGVTQDEVFGTEAEIDELEDEDELEEVDEEAEIEEVEAKGRKRHGNHKTTNDTNSRKQCRDREWYSCNHKCLS